MNEHIERLCRYVARRVLPADEGEADLTRALYDVCERHLEAIDNRRRELEAEPDGTLREGIDKYRRNAPWR